MERIIVLDEDWGDREETGGLVLAVCWSQQPCNCQISKTGINHRPQTLSSPRLSPLSFILLYSHPIYSLWFYVLVFLHFSSGVSTHLFSSVMLFTVLHCNPISSYSSPPLIRWPTAATTWEVCLDKVVIALNYIHVDNNEMWCRANTAGSSHTLKITPIVYFTRQMSSTKTEANWLVSCTNLNLQFLSFTQLPEVEVKWKRERGGECGKKTVSPF